MRPHARTDDLIVQQIGHELLVYDLQRHLAHCLNPAAALIWRHADGARTVAELASLLDANDHKPATEHEVRNSLKCLEDAQLLREPLAATAVSKSCTRRDLMRQAASLGGLTVASYSILSLVAPTPAQAQASRFENDCDPPLSPPKPCDEPEYDDGKDEYDREYEHGGKGEDGPSDDGGDKWNDGDKGEHGEHGQDGKEGGGPRDNEHGDDNDRPKHSGRDCDGKSDDNDDWFEIPKDWDDVKNLFSKRQGSSSSYSWGRGDGKARGSSSKGCANGGTAKH